MKKNLEHIKNTRKKYRTEGETTFRAALLLILENGTNFFIDNFEQLASLNNKVLNCALELACQDSTTLLTYIQEQNFDQKIFNKN